MAARIVVTIPDKLESALEDAKRQEGVDSEQVVTRAVEEYLFYRRLRLLRDRMTAKAQAMGIASDKDVFDAVS